ncbi:TolC family protein [Leptolyngbya sp. PCC 6406]|uniref:TolC family protein n=1 Tax=Leptolyngbya sp. PCC 6406 TaxID=1173264 RepID=UPI0002AC00FE|nr:TolC family protein [Leptolyngbya sp. PCC 6406]
MENGIAQFWLTPLGRFLTVAPLGRSLTIALPWGILLALGLPAQAETRWASPAIVPEVSLKISPEIEAEIEPSEPPSAPLSLAQTDPPAATDLPPEDEEGTFRPLRDGEVTGSPETSPIPPAPINGPPVLPIPPERVVDTLEYLDPDPNPLLIQTQPEEVTIIGTQPLALEDALELAYRNNPDLRVAQLELERSRAALREAQAALLPRVAVSGTLQGQSSRSTSITATGINQADDLAISANGQVDLTYNIYNSGQRAATIRTAEEQVRLAELELERRRAALRFSTTNEYYDLQRAIEQITITQAFLEEASRNLRDTQLREEVGVGTRFDVLRAEVQVANARQQLVQAQSDRQVAQRQLARRLNLPPSLDVTTAEVQIAGTWPLPLEDSIVLAYQNRAELEQQLVQREINEQQRRIALSALGPQVDLFANYGVQNNFSRSSGFVDNYSFGARVSWTIFEGGAAAARASQREADIAIADRRFEETRATVRFDVEQSYFTLQANRENINTARLALEQAREALRLARLRFEAGVGTQLDVITAQSALTESEVNLVQAILGYNRSLAALERAVSNLPERYYRELGY